MVLAGRSGRKKEKGFGCALDTAMVKTKVAKRNERAVEEDEGLVEREKVSKKEGATSSCVEEVGISVLFFSLFKASLIARGDLSSLLPPLSRSPSSPPILLILFDVFTSVFALSLFGLSAARWSHPSGVFLSSWKEWAGGHRRGKGKGVRKFEEKR